MYYAVIYHDDAFYVFGGATTEYNDHLQTISRLDTETSTWSKVGCYQNFYFSIILYIDHLTKSWKFEIWS